MNVLIKTSLGFDGVSSITMNYCRMLKKECNYTFFVIGTKDDIRKDVYKEIENNKWNIIYAPDSVKHFFEYRKLLRKTIKNGEFDLFHINGNSSLMYIDYHIAKSVNKKLKIITHSHNSNCTHRKLHFLLKPLFNAAKVTRISCSDAAGNWAYGRKKYLVIPNVIDYSKFYFNENYRLELGNKYNLYKKKVLLHIGAFVKAKNQEYLAKVFKLFFLHNPNSVAIFIGEGDEKERVISVFKEMNILDKVLFLNNQSDIYKYYSLADVFLMPSIYEGLPVVLIEAQVAGLPCIISNNISKQTIITENVVSLDIDEKNVECWCNQIEKLINNNSRNFIGKDDFSAEVKAKELLNIYCN